MSCRKYIFVLSLLPGLLVGAANAEYTDLTPTEASSGSGIAGVTYVNRMVNTAGAAAQAAQDAAEAAKAAAEAAVYTAGDNVSVTNKVISVADASVSAKGVAKLGEIPFKSSGTVTGSAMMWVE